MKLDEESKKIVKYTLIFLAVIVSMPLFLAAIIPIESNIPNFSDSNDWIGFWGSYIGGILGGLCTLIVMYFTRKDTRNIQDDIELREEERQLKAKRAFVYICLMKSDLFFHEYRGLLKEGRHFQNEGYRMIFQFIKSGWKNESDRKNKEELKAYDNYPYAILRNISNNPMYHTEVNFLDDEGNNMFVFRINTILPNENVLFSLLRFDKIDSTQYVPCREEEIKYTIEYETDYIGVRERVKIDGSSIKYTKIHDDSEMFTDDSEYSLIVIDAYK